MDFFLGADWLGILSHFRKRVLEEFWLVAPQEREQEQEGSYHLEQTLQLPRRHVRINHESKQLPAPKKEVDFFKE